jgi:lipid II:glycine glycyltransferase (peptidoglycan interpeptide bridge formation enzyme)
MVFCKVKSWLTGRRLVSLPFSDHCDPLVDTQADFDSFLSAARKDVDDRKWDYCEFRPVGFAHGLNMAGQSARYYWHVIDLRPTNAAIVTKFHHSVRRKIRRAEREALFYDEGNSERLLGQFYKLLVTTRRRHHLPPQPVKWFRSLMVVFGEKLKIRVAYKGDTPIASILTLDHKNTVTYKYGCSDARFHSLGGVALVLWNTIQRAKTTGFEKLDLGRSDISNDGLTTFKERWGGLRGDLSYWRYPNRSISHESIGTRMFVGRIVKSAPDPMLIAMGNWLYRHIG